MKTKNNRKLKGINTDIFFKKVALVLILCSVFTVGLCQVSGVSVKLFNNNVLVEEKQLTSMSSEFLSEYLIGAELGEEQVTECVIKNGLKIDSIYEYKTTGWDSNLKKYFYTYKNEKLISKKCIHFKSSYYDTLKTSELWKYNDQGLLDQYQKFNIIESWNDSVIVEDEIKYKYENGHLIEKQIKLVENVIYSYQTYNGIAYSPGDIIYNESSVLYLYNSAGDVVERKESGNSGIEIYRFDSLGRVQYLYKDYKFSTSVDKIFYEETDTTRTILIGSSAVDNENVNFDSISNWFINKTFSYTLDQLGRDSVCNSNLFEVYFYNSTFDYDANNRMILMNLEIMDENDSSKVSAHGQIEWLYSDDDRLLKYQKSYFNEVLNNWQVQHKIEYFYGSTKSVETDNNVIAENLYIFPNPASNVLMLSKPVELSANYTVYNLLGGLVTKGRIEDQSISIAELQSGTYLIRIDSDTDCFVSRFVKR